jgi:acyl-CoA thioester hydrolase
MFIWPVRVYYEDTDSGGVVYYANYLKFFERARTEWLRSLGIEQDVLLHEQQRAFIVRSVALRYRAPARFNDLLEVHSQIAQQRRASVVFEQQIINPAQGQGAATLCEGTIQVACVDSINFKPQSLPTELLHKLPGEPTSGGE